MHKYSFCQKLLDTALTNSIHASRKACLTRFLSDLLDYDTTLSVTEIGKKLTSKASVKSKIKAAHPKFQQEQQSVHDKFLEHLKAVVPPDLKVTLITTLFTNIS